MLLLACSSQSKDSPQSVRDTADEPVASIEFDFENRLMLTEQLGDCTAAAVIGDTMHVCQSQGNVVVRDEADGSSTDMLRTNQ